MGLGMGHHLGVLVHLACGVNFDDVAYSKTLR